MRRLTVLLTIFMAWAATVRGADVVVFPTPSQMQVGDGNYKIKDGRIRVNCPEAYANAPLMLGELLGRGFDIKRVGGNADVVIIQDHAVAAGGYTMDVTKKGIKIAASDYPGAAAGISTLVQLLPPECLDARRVGTIMVPYVHIADAPQFGWRGLLYDSSRHFWTVDETKRQLRTMALFKLNIFHWHLTDSQEWRIPMDDYPQFEMGCYRPLDGYIDAGVFKRRNESGNTDFDFPGDRFRFTEPGDTVYGGEFSAIMRVSDGGEVTYGGHYTHEDIAEVIAYADMLGIEVVPEIDMPGHFRGASKLLPWLSCDYVPFAALCPGRDSSLDFCKHVLSQVFKMFPSQRIHIGGDEVDRSHWRSCPDCQHRADSLGLASTDELQAWFVRQIAQFVKDNGHEVIGWQEIADDGFEPGSQATIMWWLGEDPGVVKRAIDKGFDVICTPRQYVYLDYDENHKSLRKILDLKPEEYCGDGPDALSHIKGIQGNMWTEWVPSINRLEYMVWPRLMAIGYKGWTNASPDTDDYYAIAEPQFKRLDAYRVNYHVPTLEGFAEQNDLSACDTLTVVNHLPYLQVRYTTDGSRPTLDSPVYSGPIKVTEPTHFRIGAFRPDGRCIDMFDAYYNEKKTENQ